jgi:hypothetical protein
MVLAQRHLRTSLLALSAVIAASFSTTALAASPAFQTDVLANSPYLYYRLGETTGTTAADTSTNGRNGSYVGSPTLGVPGPAGGDTAVGFSGASQYVTTDQASSFGSALGNASWEFVFSTTNLTTQTALGGSANTGSVTNWEATLNRNSAGSATLAPNSIRFFLRDDNNLSIAAAFTNTTAFDGNYHDVVFTYDKTGAAANTRLLAYVDGIQQTLSFNASGTPAAFSNFAFNNSFGARQNRATPDLFFNGNLDEVALYTSTLSAADVLLHAQAVTGAPVPEPASLAALSLGAIALLARRRRH